MLVTLYFGQTSGLQVLTDRYGASLIGQLPTQN
jgi:hypothetical protein